MTAMALEAREMLKNDGIDAAVINIATIKPIDTALLCEYAAKTGCMVTAEEHNMIGGLGSAVCEALSETCPVPVFRLGVEDKFGASGKAMEMMAVYGLTPERIAEKARLAVAAKRK